MLPETDETSSDDKTFAVELWACGWNAFGQLYFDTEERYRNPKDRHEGMKGRTYEDITTFKKILVDEKKIEFLRGGCSTVLVQTSMPSYHYPRKLLVSNRIEADYAINFIADKYARDRFIANSASIGQTLLYIHPETNEVTETTFNDTGGFEAVSKGLYPTTSVIQLVANETAWHILRVNGDVWSWGDARFPGVLGREVTEESPAAEPHIIPFFSSVLTEDKVCKISSGPYLTAAVTRDLNLYIWGQGAPTGTAVDYISNLILETDPTPINLDYDIIDVACGKNCLLALTKDRRLFVIGSNRNGQLGLGDVKSVDQWTEVLLPVKEDAMIMSVHTGYKNSFVVVKNGKAKGDKKRKRETSTEISNKNSRTAEG